MKRKLVAFLIGFFIVFNIGTVKGFCADTNEQIVSFSSIRTIMIENSLDMKIADNSLKNTKQELEKINDDIEDLGYKGSNIKKGISSLESEIDEIKTSINALKNQIESLPNDNESKASKELELSEKNKELTNKELTLDKLESYKEKRTTAQRNYKKAELTYRQTVENALYKAQQSYMSCLSTVSQLDNKKNELEYNQKKADIYKLQYEKGFLSKKEYENAIKDNIDSKNEIVEIENKKEVAINNLKLTLGISQGEDIILSNDIKSDLNEVASINYDNDLKEMLKNNIDIYIANLEIDWTKDDEKDDDEDYENYSLENKELSLDKQYITSEITFKEKYNNLMVAYNSIKSSYDKLQQSQEDYVISSKKYSYGFITKNELEKAQLDLDNKMSDFNNERNEFYLKYLDYNQMKEGY